MSDTKAKREKKWQVLRDKLLQCADSRPTEVTEVPWLWALRSLEYPDRTERTGKWLIFESVTRLDETWALIKEATENGHLGHASKVATGGGKVICVYTDDSDDYEDVHRVREELRRLGFQQKLSYKTDQATLEGRYSHAGDRNISKYRE